MLERAERCSGDFATPSPPGEQTAARHDQARQTCADNWAGHVSRRPCEAGPGVEVFALRIPEVTALDRHRIRTLRRIEAGQVHRRQAEDVNVNARQAAIVDRVEHKIGMGRDVVRIGRAIEVQRCIDARRTAEQIRPAANLSVEYLIADILRDQQRRVGDDPSKVSGRNRGERIAHTEFDLTGSRIIFRDWKHRQAAGDRVRHCGQGARQQGGG
jgi:hypothetical protein